MIALGIAALAISVSLAIMLLYAHVSGRAAIVAAGVIIGLLTLDWFAASSGALHRWYDVPPPIGLIVITGGAAALLGALLPVGARLLQSVPLSVIVGLQGFRLPLELVMHEAAEQGVMPVQMSYTGWNFDIVSGISALAVAALLATGRAPRAVLVLWNIVGSVLLLAIMGIAIASTPTFGAFGPDHLNIWIADAPFVWLPGILVPAAIWGHAMVWRAIITGTRR
jgi:hypothetical protein